MNSTGKLVLCVAVLFCFFQAIAARPRIDDMFLENVKYDLTNKCAGLERDFEKEAINVRHKVLKESIKLLKKAIKEGSQECIESAKFQAEETLEDKSREGLECIQVLKDALESDLNPDASFAEIMAFRNNFKNKLQLCKKTAKMEMKAVQNSFSSAGKACLV